MVPTRSLIPAGRECAGEKELSCVARLGRVRARTGLGFHSMDFGESMVRRRGRGREVRCFRQAKDSGFVGRCGF